MVSLTKLGAAAAACLAALPGSTAYIFNMTAPPTATPGKNITATLYTSIYVQNYVDFGIIWGISAPEVACHTCVGRQLDYTNLVKGSVAVPPSGNFTVDVTIPADFTGGPYFLVAAVPYLVGVSGSTGINYFNSTLYTS